MVIRSFYDDATLDFFKKGKVPRGRGWVNVKSIVQRKLDMLDYAKELIDLRSPPGNRLENLTGSWVGYYSIRINDQWRVVFKWDNQPFDVQVVDYH